MFIYTQKYNNFIDLFSTSTKLCRLKLDHLVNFYISLENRKRLWYLCYSMAYLHKIWHGDENAFQMHRLLKINFKNARWLTADQWRNYNFCSPPAKFATNGKVSRQG